MMEGKSTRCGRHGGGSVCLCHCPGPHHLIFCLLQDLMDLFQTNISDMVDSFVVTVKGTYPFFCASFPLTMHLFPCLTIYLYSSWLWTSGWVHVAINPVQWPVWIPFCKEFPWHGQTFSQCQDLEKNYYEKICEIAQATLENMAADKLEVDMSEEAERVSVTFHLKYQD